jgi:FAD/FMN-containing dehydrogenase
MRDLFLVSIAWAVALVGPAGVLADQVNCRKLATDPEFPTEETWKRAIPRITVRQPGDVGADYNLRAQNYAEIQAAVRFCSEHNVRLSIINSGHDFLARNDAPSGLRIDVSLLQGVRVLEEFVPTVQGAKSPFEMINTIRPASGKQAAVTIGAGVGHQKLNNALHPSKLFTIGAAHGSS